ncbi:myotubularin-related protein 3/4, partial [Paragonimus westermani]
YDCSMAFTTAEPLWFLPGETIRRDELINGGKLVLTEYRLLFIASHAKNTWSIPINLIAKVETVDLTCLKITTKLGLSIMCAFDNETTCERWQEHIFPVNDRLGIGEDSFCLLFCTALQARIPDHPFLFSMFCTLCELLILFAGASKLLCGITDVNTRPGPDFVCREFTRMKLGPSWKVTEANQRFKICCSYPEYHIVPSDIDDDAIAKMADFRSHKRFPSIVWRSQTTGAVLLRCAEPRVGWMYYRNEYDEQLMASVSRSCQKDPGTKPPIGPTRLLIVDARAYRVAQLKRFLGGGYEYSGYYDQAEICFMDMPNLHAVRVSFERLTQLYTMDTDSKCGFSVLVEREWLHFGHKFADRCGQGSGITSSDERSPIFLQWLDCVHQVRLQFPTHFEFNEAFLVKLGLHVYSGLFGTFLCNSERIRRELQLERRTCSVWGFLSRRYNWTIVNHFHEPSNVRLLEPDWRVPCLRLWNSLYRGALVPSCRISTGVIALNKTVPTSTSGNTYNESEPNVNKSTGSSTESALCTPLADMNRVEHPVVPQHVDEVSSDCDAVLSSENQPTEEVGLGSVRSEMALSTTITSQKGFQRSFLGELTNTSETACVLQHTNISTLSEEVLSHAGSNVKDITHSREFDNGVAVLPLSSANDEHLSPLGSLTAHNTCSSPNLLGRVVELPRSVNSRILSISSCEGLLMYGQRSPCLSPCPRNCSFSTDDGGVFVADEELDPAAPAARRPLSDMNCTSLANRSCVSDDDEVTRLDDQRRPRLDRRLDKATSPITISLKSGSIDCLPNAERDVMLHCVLPNNVHDNPRQLSSDQTWIPEQEVSTTDLGVKTIKLPSVVTPTFLQPQPQQLQQSVGDHSDPFSNRNAEPSFATSDYTMHSLPEGELLLVNDSSADYEECQPVVDASSFESHCDSVQVPCRWTEKNDQPPSFYQTATEDLSQWTNSYFLTCYVPGFVNRQSPVSLTSSATIQTTSSLFDSMQNLSVNANPQNSHNGDISYRPLSAPVSPSATLHPNSVGPFAPSHCLTGLAGDSQISSVVTVRPFDAEATSSSVGFRLHTKLPVLDWDGLPAFVDPVTHGLHMRMQMEQVIFRQKLSDLMNEVTTLRGKLTEAESIRQSARGYPTVQAGFKQSLAGSVHGCFTRSSCTDSVLPNSIYQPTSIVDGIPQLSEGDDNIGVDPIADDRRFSSTSDTFELLDADRVGLNSHRPDSSRDRIALKLRPRFVCRNCLDPVCFGCSVWSQDSNRIYRQSINQAVHGEDALPSQPQFHSDLLNDLTEAIDHPHEASCVPMLPPMLSQRQPNGSSLSLSCHASSAALLSSVSAGHLPVAVTSNIPSARCRSAGGSRPVASPATPDGVAQA